MVYQNKFVAVIKVDGKILREKDNNDVFLPFGSEYSILLKNLNSATAKVDVSIDGEDVLDCKSLIVYPNSETELKGKLTGTKAKNKFKFIEKTDEVSDYRGDRVDDGIIRVEVFFEKEKCDNMHHNYYHYYYPYYYDKIWWGSSATIDGSKIYCYNSTNKIATKEYLSYTLTNSCDGITVKGSEINQDFNYAGYHDFNNISEVIILRLRGTKQKGTKINKPLLVSNKIKCSTCGRTHKSSLKFCSNCGTYLE